MATKMKMGNVKSLPKAKFGRGVVSSTDGSTYTKTGKKIGSGIGKKAEYRDFTTGDGDRSFAPSVGGMSEKMKLRQSNKKTVKEGDIKMKMGGAKKPKMMSGGAKPKAMYGTSMKPGMMKKGGAKKK
jgi:hypothetical protein